MKRRTLLQAALVAPAAVPMSQTAQASLAWSASPPGSTASYLVGTGIYDITGAVAETGAFGYAAGQEMTGFHTRFYARAFIVCDQDSGRRIAYVCCDTGAIFQSVKIGVVNALRTRLGGLYTDENVMLTASHTHSGNAGLSWNKLYQVAANDGAGYGWDRRNYDAVVAGIVAAIQRAHANLEPGTVSIASREVTGATKNRSAYPYTLNPDAKQYSSNVNTTMVQLNFVSAAGEPLGVLNWFAIHPTSFALTGTYLNSDNKGYAQWLFEKKMGTDVLAAKTFVAAFANTDAGDVVSTQGNSKSSPGYQGDPDDFENVRIDGLRQYEPASALWGTGTALVGPVDYRSRWIDLAGRVVSGEYTNGAGDQVLAIPARGWSFAAGGPNGPSNVPGVYAGMTVGSFNVGDTINQVDTSALGTLTRLAFAAVSTLGGGCADPRQGDKPILLPDGKWGWTPLITQLQIMRVGQLAIVSMPGEITTMCGRRIRAQVLRQLADVGIRDVVVACYANDYEGYTTTPEEYGAQYYEGASTEFGPYQLSAFLQEYGALSAGLLSGSTISQTVQPPDLLAKMPPSRPGVVFDDVPVGQRFGQVLTQPASSYVQGDIASAVFRGGHPKNNFRTMSTFLEVQRKNGDRWEPYRTDRDWDTSYGWQRQGIAYSRVTITWRIAADTPPGRYRLVHHGESKSAGGIVSSYRGVSAPFTVS